MTSDERLYWVAVSQCPGIGALRFSQVFQKLQNEQLSFQQLWKFTADEVTEFFPWPSVRKSFLTHRQQFSFSKLEKSIERHSVQVLTCDDEQYPYLLQQIPNKPPVIFVKGSLSGINISPYAVVGTRKITSYGRFVTQKIVKELVANNCAIVSGFMYGVDAVAHQTAVDNNGYTVGVLGYGFDHIYPKSNEKLAAKVLQSGGALISEYFFDVTPHPGNFPARNRIVAGLSLGVVVTEAASKSGSKITARYAGEYGREVFSVPGAITSQYSEGTKDLINEGAKLVSSAEDILQEMQGIISTKTVDDIVKECSSELDKQIIETLAELPQDFDELSFSVDIEAAELATQLSMLELQGLIIQEGGKYVVRF